MTHLNEEISIVHSSGALEEDCTRETLGEEVVCLIATVCGVVQWECQDWASMRGRVWF